jgi:hypothetical protein
MYRSLLVPLDGLVSSEAALPVAVGITRRTGATLHLEPQMFSIVSPCASRYNAEARAISPAAASCKIHPCWFESERTRLGAAPSPILSYHIDIDRLTEGRRHWYEWQTPTT